MPVRNPWYGCHKISAGCRHCYVYREDAARGVAVLNSDVHKTSSFRLPISRDCRFTFFTKRIERFAECLPDILG